MGIAITAGDLLHTAPIAAAFVAWLRELFAFWLADATTSCAVCGVSQRAAPALALPAPNALHCPLASEAPPGCAAPAERPR